MFGISKHAKEIIGLLSDGGITHSEAMNAIDKYDRIMLRWQITILSIVISAAILFVAYSPESRDNFDNGYKCVLAKIRPGMSSDVAKYLYEACMIEFGGD